MLPFGGTFDLVQLKGSTLKKAFEHSVHRYGLSTGEFLQVGGKSPSKMKWDFLLVGLAPLTRTSMTRLVGVFPHPTPMHSLSVVVDSQTTETRSGSKPQGLGTEHCLPTLIWTLDGLSAGAGPANSKQVNCLEA